MPPRKRKTWKDNSLDLMDDHGIFFEGPRQPRKWPREYRQLFGVIRDIWTVRYAAYKSSSKLTPQALQARRRSVRVISHTAHRHHSGRINEATWRGLEEAVMGIFQQNAICEVCKNELHMVEYEAEPSTEEEIVKLKRKRRRRKPCTCNQHGGSIGAEHEDCDEDQPVRFTDCTSTAMTHDSGDELEHIDVPMVPDRTIGLSVSPQTIRSLKKHMSKLRHCPMSGTSDNLYPFLLIEAKRAVETPGFAAIEAQTAFPLRRLLRLQKELQEEAKTRLDPLVWFFAYQGEEWRLYAGTLDGTRVLVYDLWHGTIESLDGSLQLLQIVDYIWTWARDIYRPQVRKCLFALAPKIRETSPWTESNLSRSQSVLSDLRLDPSSASPIDTVMKEVHQPSNNEFGAERAAAQDGSLCLPPSDTEHQRSEQCNFPQTQMRYANLVHFSFRVFHLPTYDQVLHSPEIESIHKIAADCFHMLFQSEMTVVLGYTLFREIESLWTWSKKYPMTAKETAPVWEGQKCAYLYFRTFCRREDWHIVRELSCVLWDIVDVQAISTRMQPGTFSMTYNGAATLNFTTLLQMLHMVRDLTGDTSIAYALGNIRLTLSNDSSSEGALGLRRWSEDRSTYIEHFETLASRLGWSHGFYQESARMIALESNPSSREVERCSIPEVPPVCQTGGVIAKKPRSWPAQCPKFCLFTTLDVEASDREQLGKVLSGVVDMRNYCGITDERLGHEELVLNKEDRRVIKEWLRSFEK